jgi:hypothetical protein
VAGAQAGYEVAAGHVTVIAPAALVTPPAPVTPPVEGTPDTPPVCTVSPPVAVTTPPVAGAPPAPLLLLPELTQAEVRLAANTPKSPKWVVVRKRLLFC